MLHELCNEWHFQREMATKDTKTLATGHFAALTLRTYKGITNTQSSPARPFFKGLKSICVLFPETWTNTDGA